MNTATFDTLSAARSLEAAGIESKQAEAIADPAHVPRAVVEHVAAQLGIDDLSALERYWDSQTRWDHQAEIRRRYRYQPFGQARTWKGLRESVTGRSAAS